MGKGVTKILVTPLDAKKRPPIRAGERGKIGGRKVVSVGSTDNAKIEVASRISTTVENIITHVYIGTYTSCTGRFFHAKRD